jgi:RNA polymerase sigma factor (sigma-70 family)
LKSKIDNNEYERLLNDINYKKQLNKLVRKYRRYIDHDELEQIKRIALFQAMSTYDSSKSKFNTHLLLTARFMILDHIRSNVRYNSILEPMDIAENSYTETHDWEELTEGLSAYDAEFLHNRYVKKMSHSELGKLYKISSQASCNREMQIRYKLKCLLK